MSRARSVKPRPSNAWIDDTSRSLATFADDPVRVAFLRRALGEVLAFAQQDESVLLEALSTPAQMAPRLRELVGDATPPAARWTRAREAGQHALLALLDTAGGTLTPEQVAARLGRSRQAVHQRLRNGQLLAVPGARGAAYPVWQFTESGVLPGFPEALGALGDTPPVVAVQFFLSGRDSLGGETPLDALRAGHHADVARAAEAFAAER
jgi:hypothetical protein